MKAVAIPVDFLESTEKIEAALERAVAEHGPFDTLVHAVGPLVVKRFANASLEDYATALDGNLRSAMLAARATLPSMREARFGRVIFFGMIGSGATRPFRGFSLYQSAKSALVAFARCLALEEASHGITINVVSPGDVREKTLDRAQALMRAARNPRGRVGSYEDVADVVRFLIAPQRDFITGQVIEVTGGLQTATE